MSKTKPPIKRPARKAKPQETFTVTLVNAGSANARVAKAIRDLTDAANAIQVVQRVATGPQVIKGGLSMVQATALSKALGDAGATVAVSVDRSDDEDGTTLTALDTLRAYLTEDETVSFADAQRASTTLNRYINERNRQIAAMRRGRKS